MLVRGVDARGLTFFTNYDSPKSHELAATPSVGAVFLWGDLHRQVRIRGRAERVSEAESDEYFASRPRGSQIGAWASHQSAVIADRRELDDAVARAADRFAGAAVVPRPPFWGGWRIVPHEFEFWQGRPNRLHDRLRYRPEGGSTAWRIERLAP